MKILITDKVTIFEVLDALPNELRDARLRSRKHFDKAMGYLSGQGLCKGKSRIQGLPCQ